MPNARSVERPDLPEFMTWEELEDMPDEIASQIELWDGRVVWLRRGPGEHQTAMRRLTNEIERCARSDMSSHSERCWRVNLETNVFFGHTGKSNHGRVVVLDQSVEEPAESGSFIASGGGQTQERNSVDCTDFVFDRVTGALFGIGLVIGESVDLDTTDAFVGDAVVDHEVERGAIADE